MIDQHELGRLRHAGLTPFDIKVLSSLMNNGGEQGFFVADDTRERIFAGLGSLADRDLIDVNEARSTLSCVVCRLTANGREVCAQLEKMSVQPKVEVQMHGDQPEVIKP